MESETIKTPVPQKTKKLCWVTDIHLDHAGDEKLLELCTDIKERKTDILLVSGDIANAQQLIDCLKQIEKLIQIPIYFVLGNHDYYGSAISEVQEEVRKITNKSPFLNWLPDCGVVQLDQHTCLMGTCGWGDGILGAGVDSNIEINDHIKIEDFKGKGTEECFELMKSLGAESAEWFRKHLDDLPKSCTRILTVTHVPPFEEASYYHGNAERQDYLPFYGCQQTGAVLREFMKDQPGRIMQVFCGHTHTPMDVTILDNLTVRTGHAFYGKPSVQDYFRL